MAGRGLWSLVTLLVVRYAYLPVGASPISAQSEKSFELTRRSLLANAVEISSPDVSRNGACAADIALHCKHLLTAVSFSLDHSTKLAISCTRN
jgi:hypothetical protein